MSDSWVDYDALEGTPDPMPPAQPTYAPTMPAAIPTAQFAEASDRLQRAAKSPAGTNMEYAPIEHRMKMDSGQELKFQYSPEEIYKKQPRYQGSMGMGNQNTPSSSGGGGAASFDFGGLFSGLGTGIGAAAEGVSEAMARITAAEAAAGASRDDASALQELMAQLASGGLPGPAAAPAGPSTGLLVLGGVAVVGILGTIIFVATRKK